jgi:hypothetical protein
VDAQVASSSGDAKSFAEAESHVSRDILYSRVVQITDKNFADFVLPRERIISSGRSCEDSALRIKGKHRGTCR